jgi:hypothetical protein
MADEKDENRIKIEDLPQAEQELTSADAKEIKGGSLLHVGDASTRVILGTDAGIWRGSN